MSKTSLQVPKVIRVELVYERNPNMAKFLKIYNETAQGGYVQRFSEMGILLDELREGEVGEKWTVSIVEMTEEEYQALPEFAGY